MLDALQDARYALRLWWKRPAFACVAILTLALGVGANTAMFGIVNAVLLRLLPYANADRLVSLWGRTAQYPRGLLSYPEYEEIRKQTGTLETIGNTLGLKAERGRLYAEEESAPGSVKPVVVITHQLWRRRFSADPSAIGATLTLNGNALTIIGVLQPPSNADEVPGAGYFIDGDVFLPRTLEPPEPPEL